MTKNVTVLYQFSLNENADEQAFIELNSKIDEFLSACDGFQYRVIAKTEENRWQDIVYWENAECAYRETGIQNLEAFQHLMALIKVDTLTIEKAEIQSICCHKEKQEQ